VVETARRTPVKSLAEGRVLAVELEDEAHVKAGEVLFVLGGPLAEARSAELEAEVEGARTALQIAREILEQEKEALEEKLGTLKEKNTALTDVKKQEAALEAAVRRLDVHQKSLRVAAPSPGVVCRRQVHVGQDVQQGETLAEIIDPAELWIEAESVLDLRASRAAKAQLAVDLPARVEAPSGAALEVRVSLVHAESGPRGSSRFRLVGPEIHREFRPGDPARGVLLLGVRRGALAVPSRSIVHDASGSTYVVVADGSRLEAREVRTGLEQGGPEAHIEVLSGLEETERVVTSGAYRLFHRDFRSLYREED
jgi:RND family efflux transporter MFP subunit